MIANFCPTSDVHFTAPTLPGPWRHSLPGILVQLLGSNASSDLKLNVIMSIIKLVVSTLRTNLQVNLMLWEMWIQSKRRKKKKKRKNEKRVQLASNNDLYFLSPTEIFWVPHENGKQRFFFLLDLL